GQRSRAKNQTAVGRVDWPQKTLQILLAIREHRDGSLAVVIQNRPIIVQSPTSIFILRVQPLWVQMQLNVVSLLKSFAHVIVPGLSRDFQFGVIGCERSESELLHEVGEKRGCGPVLSINLQQRSHRPELNLLDVA